MASLFLVPARSGSKGILNKNMRRVGGLTLSGRAIRFGLANHELGPTVISSDSERIVRLSLQDVGVRGIPTLRRGEVVQIREGLWVHLRGEHLSTDTSGLGPLIAAVTVAIESRIDEISHTVLLQPTSPFRSSEDSVNLGRALKKIGSRGSVVSVTRVGDAHPARMYVPACPPDSDGQLLRLGLFEGDEFTPRQSLPPVFLRDGGFYAVGRELALSGCQLGSKPDFFERHWPYTLNIDTHEDLKLAQQIGRTHGI